MNNKLINQLAEVESPDFDLIYQRVQQRVAIRKIAIRSFVAAAVLVVAMVVLVPRQGVQNQEDLLSYTETQSEFTEYDPLAPLFEETQP